MALFKFLRTCSTSFKSQSILLNKQRPSGYTLQIHSFLCTNAGKSEKQALKSSYSGLLIDVRIARGILNNFFYSSKEKLNYDYRPSMSLTMSGPQHSLSFKASLKIDGPLKGTFEGCGPSKKVAELEAAVKALGALFKANLLDAHGLPIVYQNPVKKGVKPQQNQPPNLTIATNVIEDINSLRVEFEKDIVSILEDRSVDYLVKIKEEKPTITSLITGNKLKFPIEADEKRNLDLMLHLDKRKSDTNDYTIINSRSELLSLLSKHQVLIVDGETGCGKSTQVPQIIFDDWIEQGKGSLCSIIVSQPRRIAARSLSEWVAEERNELPGFSIGLCMRLEQQLVEREGGIAYYTAGTLREVINGNPDLLGVTHVILDEIHERSLDTDVLMWLLKRILTKRKDLKLILMSATVNVDKFKEYFSSPFKSLADISYLDSTSFNCEDIFKNASLATNKYDSNIELDVNNGDLNKDVDCQNESSFENLIKYESFRKNSDQLNNVAVLKVEGRKYPVRRLFLEDSLKTLNIEMNLRDFKAKSWLRVDAELVLRAVDAIDTTQPPGAILVFLPGWSDIMVIESLLNSHLKDRLWICPLHSRLHSIQQGFIFDAPPEGLRKVILSTTLAETSLTINDVVYVIDTGLRNHQEFVPRRNINAFGPVLINKDSAKQRAGRAGRLQPGIAYHLYPSVLYEAMGLVTPPEVHSLPLEAVVLRAKALLPEYSASDFLQGLIDPPSPQKIKKAISNLESLGMLRTAGNNKIGLEKVDIFFSDESNAANEALTALGLCASKVSTSPKQAKALIYAGLLKCLNPSLICATNSEMKFSGLLKELISSAHFRMYKEIFSIHSDHVAIVKLVEKIENIYIDTYANKDADSNVYSEYDLVDDNFRRLLDMICPRRYHYFQSLKSLLRTQVTNTLSPFLNYEMNLENSSKENLLSNESQSEDAVGNSDVNSNILQNAKSTTYQDMVGCFLSAENNITKWNRTSRDIVLENENGEKIHPHSGALLKSFKTDDNAGLLFMTNDVEYFRERRQMIARDMSLVEPVTAALFYGSGLSIDNSGRCVSIRDSSLLFDAGSAEAAEALVWLRSSFDITSDAVLNECFNRSQLTTDNDGAAEERLKLFSFYSRLSHIISRVL